jgi:hypothetical protein
VQKSLVNDVSSVVILAMKNWLKLSVAAAAQDFQSFMVDIKYAFTFHFFFFQQVVLLIPKCGHSF